MMYVVGVSEFSRCGAGGVVASLTTHMIGLPPVLAAGSAEMKARVAPPVYSGNRICTLLQKCSG